MAELAIHQFICRSDNFCVLVHDAARGVTASIDAPNAEMIGQALAERGWSLTHILTTHHHGDHVEGNAALKAAWGCRIVGPAKEADRIPGIDEAVREGSRLELAGLEVRVIETPGHTAGHVAYWLPAAELAFVGDTLFSLGCGRIFEGDAETMWHSLSKLAALPPETAIYCGHEYTLANARFALGIEPENEALQRRVREVEELRAAGRATLPTTISAELAANPFLRPSSPAIRKRLGMAGAPDWQVFGEIRERKNRS